MQITYGQNDWLIIGDGQWTWPDGVITQTSAGEDDPQELIFQTGSSELSRTIMARLHFNSPVNSDDDRVGISLLNNGSIGINLIYHRTENADRLEFLKDGVGSGASFEFTPLLNHYYWFKAICDLSNSICQGKVWEDGQNEPEDWQVGFNLSGDYSAYIHFGVTGNSASNDILANFDSFSLVLASEVSAFKPLFRPRNHLIGAGF